MGKTVNVAGLALIRTAIGGGALADFGYTQNGVQITTEGHSINVPGDENGGDDGPPIEIQYLGETARVRLEMTKWDTVVGNQLAARLAGGAPGAPGMPGSLVFAGGKYFRLVIQTANLDKSWNFPCAVLTRTPIEINVGTKFSRLVCEFECYKHPLTGILYNGTYQ